MAAHQKGFWQFSPNMVGIFLRLGPSEPNEDWKQVFFVRLTSCIQFAWVLWIKHSVSRRGERAAGSNKANTLLRHYRLRGYTEGWQGCKTRRGTFNYSDCLVVLVTKGTGLSGQVTTHREMEREVRCKWQIDIVWVTATCENSKQVCSRWSVLSGRKMRGHLFWHSLLTRSFLLNAARVCFVGLSCADRTTERQRERERPRRENRKKELGSKAGAFKMCPKSQRCRSSATRTHVHGCKIGELKRLPAFSHMKEMEPEMFSGPWSDSRL